MANLSNIITPTNVLTASSTNTLTNKTINGSNNTITNVSLTTGVTGMLPVANGGTGSASGVNLATSVTGTLPIANGGTGTTSTTFANLATNVTGTLPVANGGTGATSLTANNVLLGNGTSAVQVVAPGTAGNVLTSNGTTWQSTAPAASGGTITATASGAINAGNAVVINSNGTVSVGGATYSGTWSNTGLTAPTTPTGVIAPYATYDPNANALVLFYGNSSGFPSVIVGVLGTSTITWGTPVVLQSSSIVSNTYYGISTYASAANAHMYFYMSSSGTLYYSSVRISSAGAVTVIAPSSTLQGSTYINGGNMRSSILYDPTNNRLALFYSDTGVNYTQLLGGYCDTSGYFYYQYTTLVDGAGTTAGPTAAYWDTTNNIGILFWQNDSYYLWTRTVTLTNSSATLGGVTQVTSYNNNGYSIAVTKEVGGSGYIYTYSAPSGSSDFKARYATRSGSTITMGNLSSGSFGFYTAIYTRIFNFGNRLIVCNGYYGVQITVSANTPVIGSTVFIAGSDSWPQNWVEDTVGLRLIQVYRTGTPSFSITAVTDASSNITASNFLGFSSGTYANGATATVNVVGSTDNNQSGLTAGQKYYVTVSGSLSAATTAQPYAGVALSATRILVKG